MNILRSLSIGSALIGTALGQAWDPELEARPRPSPLPLHYEEGAQFTNRLVALPAGGLQLSFVDVLLPADQLPLALKRRYFSGLTREGVFGAGWASTLDVQVVAAADGRGLQIAEADGRISVYRPGSDGRFEPIAGHFLQHTVTRAENGHVRQWGDGMREEFDAGGRLTKRSFGSDSIALTYIDGKSVQPVGATDAAGRKLEFTYEAGLLAQVTDPLGRKTTFRYEARRLVEVTDAAGRTTRFGYDASGRLIEMTLPMGQKLGFAFDGQGRVTQVTGPGAINARFAWQTVRESPSLELVTTFANGTTNKLRITPGEYDAAEWQLPKPPDSRLAGLGFRIQKTDGVGALSTAFAMPGKVLMSDPSMPGAAILDDRGTLAAIGRSPPDPNALAADLQQHADGNQAPFWRAQMRPGLCPANQKDVRYDAAGRPVEFILDQGRSEKWTWDAADRLVEWTSTDGITTQHGFDGHDHLVSVSSGGRIAARFEYDPSDLLVAASDADGSRSTFAYDKIGNLTSTKLPDGSVISQSYDAANRLTRINLPDDTSSTFTYDGQGRMIKVTRPSGGLTRYAYDDRGRLSSTTDDAGATILYSYDAAGRIATIKQADGTIESYTWSDSGVAVRTNSAEGATEEEYDAAGRLIRARDVEGNEFQASYDAAGRIVSRKDSVNGTTTFTYDDQGRKTSETRNGIIRSWQYDDQGRVTAIDEGTTQATVRYLDNGGQTVTTQSGDSRDEVEYDASGRPVVERDDLGRETRHHYDDRGNLAGTKTSEGLDTAYEHDQANRISRITTTADGLSASVAYGYDGTGNVTSITGEDGAKETFQYDAAGRVIEHVDRFGNVTQQEYDQNGRLMKVSGVNGVRTIAYDDQGRVVEDADPVEGTWRFDYPKPGEVTITDPQGFKMSRQADAYGQPLSVKDALGNTITRQHDAAGRLAAFIDANQQKTIFKYSEDGRSVQRRTPSGKQFDITRAEDGRPLRSTRPGSAPVAWNYDGRGRLLSIREGETSIWKYQYAPSGRLESIEGRAGVFRYSFDLLDRLISASNPFGRKVEFSYDAPGRIATIRAPDGEIFTHRYNDKGLLQAVESSTGTTTYDYDATGRLTRITHPNKITVEYAYELGAAVKSIIARDGKGGLLYMERLTYDKRGNVTELVDVHGTSTFQYDDAGRLIAAKNADGPSEKFTYDPAGNVIGSADAARAKYDADNQLVDWNGKRIDADGTGNLTTLPGVGVLKWNVAGQLIQATLASGGPAQFAYDPEGHCIEIKTASGSVRYLYAGEQLLAEYDAKGQRLKQYVPGPDPLAWSAVRLQGKEYYPIRSRLGSIVALADANGEIVKLFRYDSYGRPFKVLGSVPLPPHFVGRPVDAQTGLIQFGARMYSPLLKRFLTPDPAGPDKDGNTYSYALGNPLAFADQSGTTAAPIIHSGPALPKPPAGPLNYKPSLVPGVSLRPRPLPPPVGMVPNDLVAFNRAVMDELRRTALANPNSPSGYVARRTLDMINSGDVKLDIRTSDPWKEGALGRCPWGKNTVIVAREGHNTIRAAAATVVHEVAHVRQSMGGAAYRMGHEFQAEFRAWLVDKTLGTGRNVGVPELVDRVLKSYSNAKGTPGNLTVKTVEKEIRHFFPGADGRALLDEFRAALRTPPKPPVGTTGPVTAAASGGLPRLTGPLANELASDAGRVLRSGAAAEARSVASILGRAGLRALPVIGTAISVITADSPADIAKAIGYMVPGVGQVLMAKDVLDFTIWAGQSLGQLAADAYLAAREKYNNFFKPLEDLAKLMEGEEDSEEEKEKKRRRRAALEDNAGGGADDSNYGAWMPNTGGGGAMRLSTATLPRATPSTPTAPSSPPSRPTPAPPAPPAPAPATTPTPAPSPTPTPPPSANPQPAMPGVPPPPTTPTPKPPDQPPPATPPAQPAKPDQPQPPKPNQPPASKPGEATVPAATPTKPSATSPAGGSVAAATSPQPGVRPSPSAPASGNRHGRPWFHKRRIIGDAVDGALGMGPAIREPSPSRSARDSKPSSGGSRSSGSRNSGGGGGGLVGAMAGVADAIAAAGGGTKPESPPESHPPNPYSDPPEPEAPNEPSDVPPEDSPEPDDVDDPFLGMDEGLPLPPMPEPSSTNDPGNAPPPEPAAPPPDSTAPAPEPEPPKPADAPPPQPPTPPTPPPAPPPPAPKPSPPPPSTTPSPPSSPPTFHPGPESEESEGPGFIQAVADLWNSIINGLTGVKDKMEGK